MKYIPKKEDEDRKTYLARVAVEFLESNELRDAPMIKYDEAECDWATLADDLKAEFDLEDETYKDL